MPDHRQHRGAHPQDAELFAQSRWPSLRAAVRDLSWLLTRGYAPTSALKLVGDRYDLVARQRLAVARCACGDQERDHRASRMVALPAVADRRLAIDGYNVLTSLEAALSGGVILAARDGCYRDMASMHGSYRKVQETVPALQLLGEFLAAAQTAECHWLLDEPVSNSGKLRGLMQDVARERAWNWRITLVPDPDPVLTGCGDMVDGDDVVATADSHVLDEAGDWLNLARLAIDARVPSAWIVDLAS